MDKSWEKEFAQKQTAGDAVEFVVLQGRKALNCLMIKSDTSGIIEKTNYDLIVRFTTEGLVHIITNPKREIDLEDVLSVLRIEEARKMRIPFDKIDKKKLSVHKAHPAIQKWQYSDKQSAIVNIKPSLLTPAQIKQNLEISLGIFRFSGECPSKKCIDKKCSWYAYNLRRCRMLRGEKMIDHNQQKIKQLTFSEKWAELKTPKITQKIPDNLLKKKFSKIAEFEL